MPSFSRKPKKPDIRSKEEQRLNSLLLEFDGANVMKKTGETRTKELRSSVLEMMSDLAIQVNKDTRLYMDKEHGIEATIVKATSMQATPDAFDLLDDAGVLHEVTELVIDREKLEMLLAEGKISEKLFRKILKPVTSERLYVKRIG